MTPYVYYAGMASAEVVSISREMAQQADVPYMVCSNVSSGGCYNYAATRGIPSILIERGQMGGWTEAVSYTHLKHSENQRTYCCRIRPYAELYSKTGAGESF